MHYALWVEFLFLILILPLHLHGIEYGEVMKHCQQNNDGQIENVLESVEDILYEVSSQLPMARAAVSVLLRIGACVGRQRSPHNSNFEIDFSNLF